MRRFLVVLAACGSKDPASAPGSGSAPPPPPRDAATAAVVDAGGPAIDPALAVRIPDTLIATFVSNKSGGLDVAIYKLDRSGVHRTIVDPDAGNTSIGWVDAHTLLVANEHYEQDVTITRFVDGARTDVQQIDHADWPSASGSLVGTKTGEAWLVTCDESSGPQSCKRSAYLPVWPKRGPIARKQPKDLDDGHFVGTFAYAPPAWMLPPAVAGPPAVTLAFVKVKTGRDDYQREIRGVSCQSSSGTASYPTTDYDPAYDFQAKATRWVLASPPVFELAADVRNPVDQLDRNYYYFRACSDKPFAGFAWFGDGVWAAYTPSESDTGTWTVHVDATPVATFAGIEALRTNRQPARK